MHAEKLEMLKSAVQTMHAVSSAGRDWFSHGAFVKVPRKQHSPSRGF